jgi:hypothetical protein
VGFFKATFAAVFTTAFTAALGATLIAFLAAALTGFATFLAPAAFTGDGRALGFALDLFILSPQRNAL